MLHVKYELQLNTSELNLFCKAYCGTSPLSNRLYNNLLNSCGDENWKLTFKYSLHFM
jgi:hypothetical protein